MPPPSRQSRHLWVGNLPEDIDKDRITEYFSRFGKVEGVHILPQRYAGQGIAAFVDFYDVHAAVDAVQTAHTISGREIRVNYKFKDGGGGPRFGRHEQSPSRHEKERYGDKKAPRRSRSKSASSTSSSSSSTSAASKSKDGSRPSSTRSRSSSSSSSSSSDTTRDDDKKKKRKSRSRSPSPGPRLGLFVKVSNLSSRPSDNTLREDLYFELRKHCDLHTVRIYRDNEERYAVVKFRNVGDSQKMYAECNEMTFMGHKIKLSPWHPERRRSFYDNYPPPADRHYGHPFGGHPSHMHHYGGGPPDDSSLEPDTTRTLFVGNIPRGISVYELRDYFIRFGHILDVEIKKMSGQATYGFVLFFDLMSACAAKRFMDGALIGRNTIKVGFGKGTPSKSLWVDGVDPTMTDAQVEKHFSNYGTLINIGFDRQRCTVVVVYTNIETAKEAMLDLRGTIIGKTRVRVLVDFCSKDARVAFFQALEHGDLDGPDFPPGFDPWVSPGPGRGGFHPHSGRQFFRGGPHQMDYGYQPFIEGRGGGYAMDRMTQRGHHDPDYDDYGEQLRAYSAKKEREKDYRQRRHRHHSSSSESGGRSRSSSEEGERSSKKGKKRRTKVDDKEAESDVEEKSKSSGKKKKSKEDSPESDSDSEREVAAKKAKVKKKATTPPSGDDDKGTRKDERLANTVKSKNEENNEDECDATKKQILKFKVTKKLKIEPSAMLSSDSDEGAKAKEDMAAMSRKKLLAREAEKQNDEQSKKTDQVIPKDEDISAGDLSDLEEDDLNDSKKTEQARVNTDDDDDDDDDDDASCEKKGKVLKDKKLRSYRGKAIDAEAPDSDEAPSSVKKDDGRNNKKNKSGTKELPLRYREDDDNGSVKRGRHSDRPTSPSSPPPVFNRHQQKRYGSSPHRHGRRHSQGSSSPQHHRYRQQDTLSKPYRGSGHSYNSWGRSKSPRQQRGRWGSSSPTRHSPGDKRHQVEDEQGPWKSTRYSSQRGRPDKRKVTGDQDGYEGKRRRTEAGGPRSPSATPPPPPDMDEPRPQQPSEPPPTQPDPPLPSEGSFMPSSKEATREAVTVASSTNNNNVPSTTTTTSQQVYNSQPPQQQIAQQPGADTLVELLRRYPVMWQGHFTLKNDMAAVQLHFLSGNMELAKKSLPFPTSEKPTPSLRIAQRMRLEATQIEGVEKRIQMAAEHCLLLALPCGRDPLDVHAQTRALKTSFISYLMQKQAAGIINITGAQQANFVLHIFPPCPFSHGHLARVAPDLLSSASDSGHLMVIIATA